MRSRPSRWITPLAAAAIAVGCDVDRGPPVPPLPMDVRYPMGMMRIDLRAIDQALRAGHPERGLPASIRLENQFLGRGQKGLPPGFSELEAALRAQAQELSAALRSGDRERGTAALAAVRQRCAACHTQFRVGGSVDTLLR